MEFQTTVDVENYLSESMDSKKTPLTGKSDGFSMKEQMANYVWLEGRERAQRAFNIYGHIDFLRPYFNVEPKEVVNRLLNSLVPRLSNSKQALLGELYGPLMVVLSLIALLLYGMKTSGHEVKEGTLMGTALGVCFTYWFGISFLIYGLAYVCNTQISYIQTLSLLGYALFGHCLVILINIIYHFPSSTHQLFFIMWVVIGGLSSLKMVIILMNRTSGRSQRLVLLSCVVVFHMLFLLYLHFAYHETVEVLDHMR